MCFSRGSHFRANNSKKIKGHPTYIYRKINGKYQYIGLTHSKITDNVKNIKLKVNPNPNDIRNSYIRPYSSEDLIENFGAKKKGWKLSRKDKPLINMIKKIHKK